MKYFIVLRGENFETAVKGHKKPFDSLDEVKEFARLFFGPGVEYYICDENGGLIYVGFVKGGMGNA